MVIYGLPGIGFGPIVRGYFRPDRRIQEPPVKQATRHR